MRATTFSSPKGLALVVLAAALLAWRADPARAQSMFCPQGFYLRAGACTNGQDGAFSTASVGVQALSEFAQATAQQTTAGVGRATAMRREEEQQRCPPGFARRDGACRKIEGPAQTGGDGAAGSRMGQAPVALRGFRAEWPAAGEGLGLQSAIVAEPDARYGGWTQVFGDYELRSASGLGVTACCVGDVAVGAPLSSNRT